jgi:4-hydroxybutyrate CoA-transferase
VKVSADVAIKAVREDARIFLSTMCAEPQTLVETLVANRTRFRAAEIYTMFPVGSCEYAAPGMEPHFKVRTFSVGNLAAAVEERRAEYIPIHFSQIPKGLASGLLPIDVALIQASLPDESGNCSLGICVEYAHEAIEAADLVIGELNAQMPRTLGDTTIPLSRFDYHIEVSRPLLTYQTQGPNAEERQIASLAASLIEDGSVLQFGPGRIQKAILLSLFGKRDLGIHTGLFTDDLLPLVDSRTVTGARKTIDREMIVATSVIGTSKVYDFVHDNSAVSFQRASYTHAARTLSKIDNFVSLNSAIEADLSGQVNAETVGSSLVNGIGGMMDFVRGSMAAKGGNAIVCLPSTAKGGGVSRIVPAVKGRIVTAGRADVRYIVTEHGIADLFGASVAERAKQLISIAHPRFRSALEESAAESGIL